jgi:hypothetical protein
VDRENAVNGIQSFKHLVSEVSSRPAAGFSMLKFIVLLMLFWPAAFFYAGKYALSRQRHNETMQALINANVRKLDSIETIQAR